MNANDLAHRRMRDVGLSGPSVPEYTDVIHWLGAVQAQDYGAARWSIARAVNLSNPVLGQAVSSARIIPAHVLRPAWHFVLPENLRWMVELTAPRVHALNRYEYRQHGLDDALLRRCAGLLKVWPGNENYLAEREIGERPASSGIEAAALRLGYILIAAELEGLICSGPLRGKQQTYALLGERIPVTVRGRTGKKHLPNWLDATSVVTVPRQSRTFGGRPAFPRPTSPMVCIW
jgi:hypothetical protein